MNKNYDKEDELINSAFDIMDKMGYDGDFGIYKESDIFVLITDERDRYKLKIVDNKYILVG